MKEVREFKTRINRKHKFGEDSFIKGNIVGIAEGLGITRDEEGMHYSIHVDNNYRYIITRCTEDEFTRFREIVMNSYGTGQFSGLIEFDI